jgi:hypothetical protein
VSDLAEDPSSQGIFSKIHHMKTKGTGAIRRIDHRHLRSFPDTSSEVSMIGFFAWHVIGIVSFLCRIVVSLGLGGGLDLEQLIERRGVGRFVTLAGIDPGLFAEF